MLVGSVGLLVQLQAHVLAALDPKPIATRAVPLNAQPVPGSGSGMGVAALPTKDVHTPVPPRETIAVHSEAPPSSVLTQPQTAEIVRPSNNTISFPDQSVRPSLQISSTPVLPASVSAMPLSSAVTMGNMQHASSAVAASHSSSAYVQQGLLQGGGVKAVTGAQAAVHANSQVVAAVHTSAQVAAHTSAQAAHTSAQAVHSGKWWWDGMVGGVVSGKAECKVMLRWDGLFVEEEWHGTTVCPFIRLVVFCFELLSVISG